MGIKSIHIPSYIMFPLVTFVCVSFAMGFQYYQLNTANFYQKVSKVDVICAEIILIIDLMGISFIHYLCLLIFCYPKKYKMEYSFLKFFQQPTIIINVVFIIYYGFILLLTILDVECSREMQTHISVNHFQTYIFRPQPIFSQVLYRQGIKGGSGGIEVLMSSLQYSVTHWVLFILGYVIIVCVCLVFLILNWKVFCKSFLPTESIDKQVQQQQLQILINDVQQIQKIEDIFNQDKNDNLMQQLNENNIDQQNKQSKPQQKINIKFLTEKTIFLKIYKILSFISGIVTLSVFIYYLTQNGIQQINRYVPAHWHFFYSVIGTKMSQAEIQQAINEYIERIPAGRYQLDAENYPLVTGTYEQYCSFNNCSINTLQVNKNDKYQTKQTNTQELLQNITEIIENTDQYNQQQNISENIVPNILFITYESFSPIPTYLKDEFIQNPELVKQGSPYNQNYMPNIDKLAQKGTTFLGTTSKSLPTVSGWWSLNYGESASLKGLNMQRSVDNDIDSFVQKIHQLGYYTSYLNPADFKFDGKVNWIFNNYQSFDEAWYMVPNKQWKNILNVDSNKNAWVGDRITANQMIFMITIQMLKTGRTNISYASKTYANAVGLTSYQAEYYLREQLNEDLESGKYQPEQGQSLYWQYFNVDTHFAFSGYDNKEQYQRFRQEGDDDYTVMIKSSDYHIGRIIDYIQQYDNNTIIYLVGDHGNRIQPFNTEEKIGENTNSYFDKNCYQKVSGNDDMFTTSSIIAYLNNTIANKLQTQDYINITYSGFSDHDDFITTLEEQIYRLHNKTQPPTARESINLFRLLQSQNYNKLSVSNTQQIIEVKYKNQLFRGSRYGTENSIFIENVIYPSCIIHKKQVKNNKNTLFETGLRYIRLNNYLSEHNRIWNDKFYNTSCQYNPITQEGVLCYDQNNVQQLNKNNYLTNNKQYIRYQTDKQLLSVIFICIIPLPLITMWVICNIIRYIVKYKESKKLIQFSNN